MNKINKQNKLCCSNVLKYFYIFFIVLFISVSMFFYLFLKKYIYVPIFSGKFSGPAISSQEIGGIDVVEFAKAEEKIEKIEKNLETKSKRKELVNFRNIFR